MDSLPLTAALLGKLFPIKGSNIECYYKHHLSDYEVWTQKDHTEVFICALISHSGFDFDKYVKQNRKAYMQGRYDSILALLKPFKNTRLQKKQPPQPMQIPTVADGSLNISEPKVRKKTEKKIEPKQKTNNAKRDRTAKKTQLTVPKSVVPNVCMLIDGYNRKAAKWGYELLTFNADSNTISGKFSPKSNSSGIMSAFKEGWRNGDLEDEWNKILKLCGCL